MSKQADISMLVPGPAGWEVWNRTQEGAFERATEGGPHRVGELEGLPSGDLLMLFPVRDLHTLPFTAASNDPSLYEDLAVMHAERLGIRPDPMAGQLSDHFVVREEGESATLLHVVLKSPGEGELPLRTPKEFDISARAFDVQGDAVAAWKELGRWVFGIYTNGKLLYAQATSFEGEAPDDAFLREIHLALGQLAIQGLKISPQQVFVWPPEGELGVAGSLSDGLGVAAVVERRPDPSIPSPESKLLPADVRAARRERKQRNQIMAAVAAVLVLYLGGIGWLAFGLWQDVRKRDRLAADANAVAEIAGEYENHVAMWDELTALVEEERSPLEVLLNLSNAIPARNGVRLTVAEIGPEGAKLTGVAPQSAPVNAFSLAVKRNADLSWLSWETEPPRKTDKGWEFRFSGLAPKEE